MLTQIQQLLAPPIFEDEEKTRLAALLYKILVATFVLPLVLVLYFLWAEPHGLLKLAVASGWVLSSLGGLFLVRRGQVKLTSLFFALYTWLLVTLTLLFAGGVRAPAFAGYTTIILLAALLCGPRIGLIFTALSIGSGLVFLYAEMNDFLPEPVLLSTTPAAVWAAVTTNFISVAWIVYLSMQSFYEVLAQDRAKELALRQLNEQLEQRVAGRTAELSQVNQYLQQEIVERQQVEQRAREGEERYRAVIEDQTEIISRLQADGTFTFVNDVYCRFFGKSSRELLGQKWQPVAIAEDIPEIEARLRTLSQDNPVVVVENRVYSGAGKLHWMQFVNRGFFDAQGQLLEIQSVGRDITERKQIEASLRQAHDELEVRVAQRTLELSQVNEALTEEVAARKRTETDLRSLLNTIPDLMFRVRKDGVFLDYKAPQEFLLFAPPSQFLGKRIDQILPADVAQACMMYLEQTLQTGEIQIFEYQLPLQGELRHQEARIIASNPDEALVIVRDIHERKQAEIRLHRAANQRLRLLEFSRALLTTLSLNRILELTRIVLIEDIPHDEFAPYWLDESARLLRPIPAEGRQWFIMPEFQNWSIPLGQGILGHVARTGQAECINQAHLDPRAIYPSGLREQIKYEHLMILPLWGPGKMIGLVALSRIILAPFTPEEFELAQLFISQAALALYNARLYAETRRSLQEQTALRQAGALISSTLDLDMVLYHIAGQLSQVVAATSVFISSYDPEKATATIVAEYITLQARPEEQTSVLGTTYDLAQIFPDDLELLQRGQPKIRQVDDPALSLRQRQHLAQYGCQTVLDIPMQIGGQSIAYASIWESRRRREFTSEEIALCQAIAQQGAISMQNARLYEHLQNQMQTLQATQAQLIQQERLAALGRLVASIAHEINNPLQAIQGFFGLLAEELGGRRRPAKIDYYLNIAGGEIDRIAGIIDRMRTFYRPSGYQPALPNFTGDFFQITQAEMQEVDIHTLLDSVLQLTNKRLQQVQVKVKRVWAKELPPLQAHPDFLKQVFLNLTLNAIDAMAERGGTLRIETRLEQMPLEGDHSQPAVWIEFSDTGVGMSSEVLSRLFEPLFSTKEYGSGIGLFTSYQIIQAHQGRITATSQMGQGTIFTILLPFRSSGHGPLSSG